jgi:hypothetical protein
MNSLATLFAALLPLQPLPPLDNGLMTNVPNIGPSRIESVNYCLKDVGVDRYQDLMTDSDFVNFERCLLDLT